MVFSFCKYFSFILFIMCIDEKLASSWRNGMPTELGPGRGVCEMRFADVDESGVQTGTRKAVACAREVQCRRCKSGPTDEYDTFELAYTPDG
jgi:hypothetical protein